MNRIEMKNLTKYYGKTLALHDVSLSLEPGKIYGLLGRNGAGKTTLLNLLTDKITPSSGRVQLDGKAVAGNDEALGKIYYMMEKNLFPPAMRVQECFHWTKVFYPGFEMPYALELAQTFGLNTRKRVKELSTGYLSIFKAICALSSKASILLFDEPVLGLDANHRHLLYRELLERFSQTGSTMLISTHLIEEVSSVLEETIVLKEGEVILFQNVEELLSSAYMVYGEARNVDRFLDSRKGMGEESMGKFKSAIVLQRLAEKDIQELSELDLESGKVELQKLFIALTNG